jgi:hypothetical protein
MNGKNLEQNDGMVESVGSLGKRFDASDNRAYWNEASLYDDLSTLKENWNNFEVEAINQGCRRTMMRTVVTEAVFAQICEEMGEDGSLPIEASRCIDGNYLIYIGNNQHRHVSETYTEALPDFSAYELPEGYYIDNQVTMDDLQALLSLWAQFGWKEIGVEKFITEASLAIVVVRDLENMVVGAMIAEALQFGDLFTLVELTEMAVAFSARGNHLAPILIRELTRVCYERFGDEAILYGEFNERNGKAVRAAARAGYQVAGNERISGTLEDHVSIDIGHQNQSVEGWQTEKLHDFRVMMAPAASSFE